MANDFARQFLKRGTTEESVKMRESHETQGPRQPPTKLSMREQLRQLDRIALGKAPQ